MNPAKERGKDILKEFELMACLDGGGVKGSKVELAKNKLILY